MNQWQINKGDQIASIAYDVDDGWEVFDLDVKADFYNSASCSFNEQSFILNNNCLFGYFDQLTKHPINIEIKRPTALYAATQLPKKAFETYDQFTVSDYHALVDNPILYSEPDTAHFNIDDVHVEVACFSTSSEKISSEIAAYIQPLLANQKAYLGGKLPVEDYTFLIYHNLNPDKNSYIGDGLEHSNSTLILLYMALDLKLIKENVYGIASHEFFHTIMPLALHSFEIENYNFNGPKLSKHLWLYEGMTEYYTIHMPIFNGIQTQKQFVKEVEQKIADMQQFKDGLPLTTLSLNAMDRQDQYYNVYLRGTLVNLCLDIYLKSETKGAFGVKSLVTKLLQKYGPDRPFEDEALFAEIATLCDAHQVDVRTFFADYIENNKPLPLAEMFDKVGYNYDTSTRKIKVKADANADQLAARKWWINQ